MYGHQFMARIVSLPSMQGYPKEQQEYDILARGNYYPKGKPATMQIKPYDHEHQWRERATT